MVCLLVASLPATSLAESTDSEEWEWSFTPLYLWALGLDGDITVKGMPAEVDVSFSDILDQLEFIFTLHVDANNGKWGFIIDPTYIELETDGDVPGGTVTIDTDIILAEAMGFRRFDFSDSDAVFDLLFGTRYMSMDVTIDFPVLPDIEDKGQDWIDGLVGGRVTVPMGDRWHFIGRGDVSAGGSDLTWNTSALFNVKMSKRASAVLGYRYMDVDYDDGDGAELFEFDVAMSGPIVGLTISF